MELQYIVLILISAFSHSFYNFLVHKSGGNRLFLLCMFILAAISATIVYATHYTSISIPISTFLLIYGASLFYILYQVFVSKAYEHGEISRLYPLSVLSPILVPIWAVLFLHEQINIGIIAGIIISTMGAMIMKQKTLVDFEFKYFFTNKNLYKGAGFAITASVMYSIGSVFDKSSVGKFDLEAYLWVLLVCMTLNLLLYSVLFERKIFKTFSKISWMHLLIAGITAYISFYTFRAALQHLPVTVAVPIRTSSIVFALFLGIIFLKEKINAIKLIGVTTIIIGIVIINFSI